MTADVLLYTIKPKTSVCMCDLLCSSCCISLHFSLAQQEVLVIPGWPETTCGVCFGFHSISTFALTIGATVCVDVQGLLRELLHLVGDNKQARKAVLGVYGEVLGQRNLQEDSALAFMAAQDLPRALEAYKAAGHYQMVMILAGVSRAHAHAHVHAGLCVHALQACCGVWSLLPVPSKVVCKYAEIWKPVEKSKQDAEICQFLFCSDCADFYLHQNVKRC